MAKFEQDSARGLCLGAGCGDCVYACMCVRLHVCALVGTHVCAHAWMYACLSQVRLLLSNLEASESKSALLEQQLLAQTNQFFLFERQQQAQAAEHARAAGLASECQRKAEALEEELVCRVLIRII